eukprot:scaffold22613_cov126-Cylindrotheca_fusiformis.AAC.5
MSASKSILKVLTTPSKIASSLDWRKVSGSVLSLDIHSDRIGLALASHPSFGEGSAATLESIPLARRGRVTEECRSTLAKLVKEHKVCGVVVSWPLQNDTHRMGAACGRVLHTLEDLLEHDSTSNIFTPSRPLCLWNGQPKNEEEVQPDEFGRLAVYGRTPPSDKHIHKASEEQYNQDENIVAANVWDDFVKAHWPELQNATTTTLKKQEQQSRKTPSLISSSSEQHWEDDYAKTASVAL